jgi:hypothetical protein
VAAAGGASVRLAAGGVLALVLATGVLFGRAWERRANLGNAEVAGLEALEDSASATTAQGNFSGRGSRGGGGFNRGGSSIRDRDLPPLERLSGSMLGTVDGLTEEQASQLFLAWDSLTDAQQQELRSSWDGHWEGNGFKARYDPLRAEYLPISEEADSLGNLTRAIVREARASYQEREDSLETAQNTAVFELIASFLTPVQAAQYDSIRAARSRSGSRGGSGRDGRGGRGGNRGG